MRHGADRAACACLAGHDTLFDRSPDRVHVVLLAYIARCDCAGVGTFSSPSVTLASAVQRALSNPSRFYGGEPTHAGLAKLVNAVGDLPRNLAERSCEPIELHDHDSDGWLSLTHG